MGTPNPCKVAVGGLLPSWPHAGPHPSRGNPSCWPRTPMAIPGLGAVPLPRTLLGRDEGAREWGEGKAVRTGQVMGVCKRHLTLVVGRAPIQLQQPVGSRQ